MKFRTTDAEVVEFEGETAVSIVAAMRSTSHSPSDSLAAYMRETAQRAKLQTGLRVRSTDAGDFLADLVDSRLVERVE